MVACPEIANLDSNLRKQQVILTPGGKSLCSAPLFSAASGNVSTKGATQQYRASSSQPPRHAAGNADGSASPLWPPLRGHLSQYLASCGIDVWRIQLHGCWAPVLS